MKIVAVWEMHLMRMHYQQNAVELAVTYWQSKAHPELCMSTI